MSCAEDVPTQFWLDESVLELESVPAALNAGKLPHVLVYSIEHGESCWVVHRIVRACVDFALADGWRCNSRGYGYMYANLFCGHTLLQHLRNFSQRLVLSR